ncbi:MAG: MFS transporter [Planctomycetota bacterium]|jgi:MFS family permease|nr:MFS transporter [Planctomycetota bacterium]
MTRTPRPELTCRARFIIYLVTAIMDMVVGTILFVVPVRAAQLGTPYFLVGALGVSWAAGTAAMSFIVGRFVTSRNAALLGIAGCTAQAACCACLALTATAEMMFPFLVLSGISHITYMAPYQVVLKEADAAIKKSLSSSVGVYTFAWSMGMAFGPLWSGFLIKAVGWWNIQGWQWCFIFTIAASLAVAGAIYYLRRFIRATDGKEVPRQDDGRPDFAKVAWFSAFCGAFAFSLVRGLFPAAALNIGVGEDVQGGVIFCMGFLQAISGLLLARWRHWVYHPVALVVLGALGAAGMTCFLAGFSGMAANGWLIALFFLGALLFGIYSGSFYFYTVYHALVHPTRAGFNIGINEGMFATANIASLLFGGIISDLLGTDLPYLFAGVLIVLFTLVQTGFHRRNPWPRRCGVRRSPISARQGIAER